MNRFADIPLILRAFQRIAFALWWAVGMTFILMAQAQSQVVAPRDNPVLGATVTSVETNLGGNGWHYLTASVHLENLTRKPLVLGVETARVSANDDRHNSYAILAARGIGEITGSRTDARFALPAEGGGDALFELRWRGERSTIFGTTFALTLPVRVIVPLEAGQVKLGPEYLLTFTGLKTNYVATPKAFSPLSENTVNAGPFTMQITRMTATNAGRWHIATLAARIQNTSTKPLTLAYESTSSFGIDDKGNRYYYGGAGTHDTSVSGIGIQTGSKADPQFVLAPGESRDVQFTVRKPLGREEAGRMLTYYVALAQLEVLPGNQIRTTRQYSLTFPQIPGLN